MLEKLVNGTENSQILLLQDSCGARGEDLLKTFLCSLSQRVSEVHLLLLEYLPSTIVTDLPAHVAERLKIHDIASDPLGWSGESNITMETDLVEYIKNTITPTGEVAIVVDCISNLIMHRSVAYTCQFLHRSTRSATKDHEVTMVTMVHRGLHDNSVLAKLHHTATSVLDLHPARDPSYSGACQTLHKKATGKVLQESEHYKLSLQHEILDVEEIRGKLVDTDSPSQAPAPDPAANLTFNLSLSDREKEDRANLVLPYMNVGRPKVPLGSGSEAKIFYQPDEADDFDEEDPDEDLNI